ncbi:S1 family peptidase [Deinococcus gobiensis]|uniref:Serine protease n=1 Tax=Deinococcus gobiensis (strain DSM 21396 / JCM 16679 / CGMCC 1.7299 / I-0) TaxID=745776 RepID=H8H2M7_DEIGI|nr:serine protease [Deinococcus gobiensis]AFD27774.1 Serine protease do-like protein [Deinococcus gobiensis I-0]
MKKSSSIYTSDDRIADTLLEYFRIENSIVDPSKVSERDQSRIKRLDVEGQRKSLIFKNVLDFIRDKAVSPIADTLKYEYFCKKLVSEGLLVQMGQSNLNLFSVGEYLTESYEESIAEYGGYTLLINGFKSVRDYCIRSVTPIETYTELEDNGEHKGIGTAFYIGDNMFVTAKHVLKDTQKFRLLLDGEMLNVTNITFSDDLKLDIALISVESPKVLSLPAIRLGTGMVLDDIIAMGFPKITSGISEVVVTTSGEIVAEDYIYSAGRRMHIINAKVKGGNSGGPILNSLGQAVGIVTNDELDEYNQGNVFGLAVPSEEITKILNSTDKIVKPVRSHNGWSSFRKDNI